MIPSSPDLSLRSVMSVENQKGNISTSGISVPFDGVDTWLKIIDDIERKRKLKSAVKKEDTVYNQHKIPATLKDLVCFIYKGNDYKTTSRIKIGQNLDDFQDACNRIGFCRAAPFTQLSLSRSIDLETGNCGEMADIICLLCYGYGLSTEKIWYHMPEDSDFEHVVCRIKTGGEYYILDPWSNISCPESDYLNILKDRALKWQKKGKFVNSGLDIKEAEVFFTDGTPGSAEVKPDTLLRLVLYKSISWTDKIYDIVEDGVLLNKLREKIIKKAKITGGKLTFIARTRKIPVRSGFTGDWYCYIGNPLLANSPKGRGLDALKKLIVSLACSPTAENLNIVAVALTAEISDNEHVANKIAKVVVKGGRLILQMHMFLYYISCIKIISYRKRRFYLYCYLHVTIARLLICPTLLPAPNGHQMRQQGFATCYLISS